MYFFVCRGWHFLFPSYALLGGLQKPCSSINGITNAEPNPQLLGVHWHHKMTPFERPDSSVTHSSAYMWGLNRCQRHILVHVETKINVLYKAITDFLILSLCFFLDCWFFLFYNNNPENLWSRLQGKKMSILINVHVLFVQTKILPD